MSDLPLRVLVIGYVWPEPNSSAAGSRMMQLLDSFLVQGWRVDFASPAQPTEHQVDLAAQGIASHVIRLNCSSFDQFLLDTTPNIVVFDRFMMEEQFGWRVEKYAPQALRILNTEDLHSLRHARHQALKAGRDYQPQDLHSELAIREVAAIFRSDLTLMISAVETRLLQQQFQMPATQLYTLPFMLQPITATQKQQRLSFTQRRDFVSIGNFRHAPNWDAVLYLKQTLWPAIRQQLPDASVHIYGAYPPPKATQLHNPAQGFLIKGWADDAKQVVGQARVLLAPLRFGAGLKGKLVEAMQTGTPSVTTPLGAEGMHAELPWSGAIGDDETAFIQQAVNLYTNEDGWQQAQQQGDHLLEQLYNRAKLEPDFIARVLQQYQQRDSLRQQHFIGQMLRHHSMKSTQYMAQWIEAKNKHN
ncbi:glycosyltransferase [Nitrincola sp.]|uniref:glycosyltransferase n=1 Tax=Nitrincola sp. TaxID=1926584 RepID=UPI003A91D031